MLCCNGCWSECFYHFHDLQIFHFNDAVVTSLVTTLTSFSVLSEQFYLASSKNTVLLKKNVIILKNSFKSLIYKFVFKFFNSFLQWHFILIFFNFSDIVAFCFCFDFIVLCMYVIYRDLYIWLTISPCYGSIPLALGLIGRDGGLSTLCHSRGFACQQRVLKMFPGPGYLHSEDAVV